MFGFLFEDLMNIFIFLEDIVLPIVCVKGDQAPPSKSFGELKSKTKHEFNKRDLTPQSKLFVLPKAKANKSAGECFFYLCIVKIKKTLNLLKIIYFHVGELLGSFNLNDIF